LSRNHDGAKSKYRKFLVSKSVLVLNYSSYLLDLVSYRLFFAPETKNEAEGKAVQ